jgi:hypothetical protein
MNLKINLNKNNMEAGDKLNNLMNNNQIIIFDKNLKVEDNEEGGAFIESVYDSVINEEFVIISKIFL